MDTRWLPAVLTTFCLVSSLTITITTGGLPVGSRGCIPCINATSRETPSVVLWYRGKRETSRELLVIGTSDGREVKMAEAPAGLRVDPWTQTLTIRAMRKQDFRSFSCLLIRLPRMHFSYQPAVPYTKHAVFACSPPVNSTEVKLMLWFRGFVNSSLLHAGDLLFVTETSGRVHRTPSARFDMAVNTTSYSLSVEVVVPSDVGFTCVAVPADKLLSSHARPQPAGGPGSPRNVTIHDITSRAVTMSWVYGGDGGFPPLSAEIDQIVTGRDASWEHAHYTHESCDLVKQECHVTVTGLKPKTSYRFKVCAINSHEDGPLYSDYSPPRGRQAYTAPVPAVSLLPVYVSPGLLALNWTLGSQRSRPRSLRSRSLRSGAEGMPEVLRSRPRGRSSGPALGLVVEYQTPASQVYHRYPNSGEVELKEGGVTIHGDFNPQTNYSIQVFVYEYPHTSQPSLTLLAYYTGQGGQGEQGEQGEQGGQVQPDRGNGDVDRGPLPEVRLMPVQVSRGQLVVRWTVNHSESPSTLRVAVGYEVPGSDIYSRFPREGHVSAAGGRVAVPGDLDPGSDYTVYLLVYIPPGRDVVMTVTGNYTGIHNATASPVLLPADPVFLACTLLAVVCTALLVALVATCIKTRR